jgi:hypothetical protein
LSLGDIGQVRAIPLYFWILAVLTLFCYGLCQVLMYDLLLYDRATGFLAFMNGYTVFLGPFAGIMITDVKVIYRVCDALNDSCFVVLARASRSCGCALHVSPLRSI